MIRRTNWKTIKTRQTWRVYIFCYSEAACFETRCHFSRITIVSKLLSREKQKGTKSPKTKQEISFQLQTIRECSTRDQLDRTRKVAKSPKSIVNSAASTFPRRKTSKPSSSSTKVCVLPARGACRWLWLMQIELKCIFSLNSMNTAWTTSSCHSTMGIQGQSRRSSYAGENGVNSWCGMTANSTVHGTLSNFFYDPHQNVPFLSNCLSVRNVPGVKEKFTVNKNIKSRGLHCDCWQRVYAHQPVLKTSPPFVVPSRCQTRPFACRGCTMEKFCSKECVTNVTHHTKECNNRDSLFGRVMSRATALFGSSDSFREFTVSELRKFPTKSMNFFSYNWNLIEPGMHEKHLFVISFVNSINRSVEDMCSQMQQIESVNSRTIRSVDEDAGHNGREICKSEHSSRIGLIINPLLSIVSISFHPNAVFLTIKNKIVLMVFWGRRRYENHHHWLQSLSNDMSFKSSRAIH